MIGVKQFNPEVIKVGDVICLYDGSIDRFGKISVVESAVIWACWKETEEEAKNTILNNGDYDNNYSKSQMRVEGFSFCIDKITDWRSEFE